MDLKLKRVKKYFGNFNISPIFLIIFSVITGVYTGLINSVSFLKNTSFTDIAVYPDCWILFAVFIIVNSKNVFSAAAKCFLFFLISQPLVYLVEVPFTALGFGIFMYYKRWFIITLLTPIGAAVAYLLKRGDILSTLVLAFTNGYLGFMSATYFYWAFGHLLNGQTPFHLLSGIFALLTAVFFSLIFLDKKAYRIIVLGITPIAFAAGLLLSILQ